MLDSKTRHLLRNGFEFTCVLRLFCDLRITVFSAGVEVLSKEGVILAKVSEKSVLSDFDGFCMF